MRNIEECAGYKSLLDSVEHDEKTQPKVHDYRAKFRWVLARASNYAEKTGLDAADILDGWEKQRDYWYMNYYQDVNQPEIKDDNVRVFETSKDLLAAIGKHEFRCPMCGGVANNPYRCTSGKFLDAKDVCDWKAYGLLGTLGKGVSVFVKEKLKVETIFMPLAWET